MIFRNEIYDPPLKINDDLFIHSKSTMFWDLKQVRAAGNSRQRRKYRRFLNRKYPGLIGKAEGIRIIT